MPCIRPQCPHAVSAEATPAAEVSRERFIIQLNGFPLLNETAGDASVQRETGTVHPHLCIYLHNSTRGAGDADLEPRGGTGYQIAGWHQVHATLNTQNTTIIERRTNMDPLAVEYSLGWSTTGGVTVLDISKQYDGDHGNDDVATIVVLPDMGELEDLLPVRDKSHKMGNIMLGKLPERSVKNELASLYLSVSNDALNVVQKKVSTINIVILFVGGQYLGNDGSKLTDSQFTAFNSRLTSLGLVRLSNDDARISSISVLSGYSVWVSPAVQRWDVAAHAVTLTETLSSGSTGAVNFSMRMDSIRGADGKFCVDQVFNDGRRSTGVGVSSVMYYNPGGPSPHLFPRSLLKQMVTNRDTPVLRAPVIFETFSENSANYIDSIEKLQALEARYRDDAMNENEAYADTEFVVDNSQRPNLCLVQLLFRGRCGYVPAMFDWVAIRNGSAELIEAARRFLRSVFTERQNPVYMFDIRNDLIALRAAGVVQEMAAPSTVDLRHFYSDVMPEICTKIEKNRLVIDDGIRLSDAVQLVCGVCVDKSLQNSSWDGDRPLDRRLIRYALLDPVAVLLAVHGSLNGRFDAQEFIFRMEWGEL